MASKKIEVQGLQIRVKSFNEKDYISLTDIAAKAEGDSKQLILRWIQNVDTLLFLQAWEELHNPDFKVTQMNNFRLKHLEKRYSATAQKYIEQTNAIGIISKSGRYGGTYAHKEIALNFCYWISPQFQVYMYKAFTELMEQEFQRKNLEWHISKITDNIDEVRNLLDTIPLQNPKRNRLNKP